MVGSLRRLSAWAKPMQPQSPDAEDNASPAGCGDMRSRECGSSEVPIAEVPDAHNSAPPVCPAPSANHHLIENTRRLAENIPEGDDGRIRTRSCDALDICATPTMIPVAINAFMEWLRALDTEGIPVEIRCVDGWRVCALVDGIPLAIRVKERRRRVAQLQGFSATLERWMGGRPRSVLRPSGKLELHVMRFGTSSIAVPFDETDPASSCKDAIRGLRQAALWERNYRISHQQQTGSKITVTPISRPIRKFRQDAMAQPTAEAEPADLEYPSEEDMDSSTSTGDTAMRMSTSLTGLANAAQPEPAVAMIRIPAGASTLAQLSALTQPRKSDQPTLVRRRRRIRKVTSA